MSIVTYALAVGLALSLSHAAIANPASGSNTCETSTLMAERLDQIPKSALSTLRTIKPPSSAPEMVFSGASGETLSLSQFHGRTVLVKIWATWCPFCRQEMPDLDALQARFGSDDFEVVAISVDARSQDQVERWLSSRSIETLQRYFEPSGRLSNDLRKSGHLVGLPLSLLVGPDGCEFAILKGGADWGGDDANLIIEEMLSIARNSRANTNTGSAD